MISPLWRARSIKSKFSIVIVAAIGMAVTTSQVGYALGWPIWLRPLVAVALALIVVQWLARGMTGPLRGMTKAAQLIADGKSHEPILTSSVDEVGQLAAAFNSMVSDLAAADRHRRDLVANVSHELRTPIAGIKATLENILDGVSQPTPELLAAVYARVDRLHRLVESLLDLSRLETGSVTLQRASIGLAHIANRATEECRLDHPEAEIKVCISDDLMLYADPERLHQVLFNLLENALTHGRAPVIVDARLHSGTVELSVIDHGSGLPDNPNEFVFERFYRADKARTNSGGSGLGLAIVRWITELHGGRVYAANHGPPETPAGAKFVVTLPAASRLAASN